MHDVDGVNAGYARLLLDEYLENPEAVLPSGARFSRAATAEIVSVPAGPRAPARDAAAATATAAANGRRRAAAPATAAPRRPDAPTDELLGGVAAAMALVKAHRMHGHLAARLDPLGSEPVGDPALDPLRLEPKLTPELQARIPASVLRIARPRRDARRGAAAAPGDLLRDDGLRDRAHRQPRAARLAAQGDRVVALPHSRSRRRAAARSTRGSARSRRASATCAARSSARSSSRSRASTC